MTVEKSKLNRILLYHNLAEYKMTNTLTTKIIDYRDTFVNINESYSSKRVLSVGVPQGSVLGPVLYLIETSPLREVIESYNINYHLYADDSQLYVAFKTNDASSIKTWTDWKLCWWSWFVVGWIAMILSWTNIKLKLFSSLQNFVMALLWVTCKHWKWKDSLSDKAASLGVVLDKQMSFDHHMKHLCKSLVCQFRNLFKIRKYLNKEPAATFVYAFITSKLDFCNSFFMDYPIINWGNFNCYRTWQLVLYLVLVSLIIYVQFW